MRNSITANIPQLWVGPHNPIFFRYANLVESAIREMKIKPEQHAHLNVKADQNMLYSYEPLWWKWGGIKYAHLHFEDQVYLLNPEQWKTFSKSLIEGFKAQLGKAGSVSFENAQGISCELENLP